MPPSQPQNLFLFVCVSESMLPVGVYMKYLKTRSGDWILQVLWLRQTVMQKNWDGLPQEKADPRCCGLLFLLFLFVLFHFWWVEGMCVHMNVGTLEGQREHWIPQNWSYKWLCSAIWMLGTEIQPSARAARAQTLFRITLIYFRWVNASS